MDAAPPLDWSDLAQLLAVRRVGSLAGAARSLSVDATTVGRRLKALEDALGVPLVKRSGRAIALTDAGGALADVAAATERGIADVRRRVAIEDEAPQGAVRLTTLEVLASRFVAPALPRLRERHPGLLLEIDTSAKVRDLARGEADWLRLQVPGAPVALRTDSVSTALEAVRAGAGLRLLPDTLADGLVRVELDASAPPRGV